jgi:hypothetical protein
VYSILNRISLYKDWPQTSGADFGFGSHPVRKRKLGRCATLEVAFEERKEERQPPATAKSPSAPLASAS